MNYKPRRSGFPYKILRYLYDENEISYGAAIQEEIGLNAWADKKGKIYHSRASIYLDQMLADLRDKNLIVFLEEDHYELTEEGKEFMKIYKLRRYRYLEVEKEDVQKRNESVPKRKQIILDKTEISNIEVNTTVYEAKGGIESKWRKALIEEEAKLPLKLDSQSRNDYIKGIATNGANSSDIMAFNKDFSVKEAYDYLHSRGLGLKSDVIKISTDNYKSSTTRLKRAKIIELVKENNLLENFCETFWPSVLPEKYIKFFKDLMIKWHNSVQVGTILEDEEEDEDEPEILKNINENEYKADLLFVQNSKNETMSEKRIYFESKGSSAFIKLTRIELIKVANSSIWKIGGDSSLIAKHLQTIKTIANKFGKGLITQIWLERPNKGYARCKFEVAYKISSMSKLESDLLRERIAGSLRSFMVRNGLPKEVEEATGSTVIATRINLSRIQPVEDDININIDKKEINKIIGFYKFLDEKLNEWNNTDSINRIEI